MNECWVVERNVVSIQQTKGKMYGHKFRLDNAFSYAWKYAPKSCTWCSMQDCSDAICMMILDDSNDVKDYYKTRHSDPN